MYRAAAGIMGVSLLAGLSLRAETEPAPPYGLEFDPEAGVVGHAEHKGRKSWFITVRFAVTRLRDPKAEVYKIVVEEEGKRQLELDVPPFDKKEVVRDDLAVVLEMDTSGSMSTAKRLEQTQLAARTFLTSLPARADAGMVFFHHKVYREIRPSADRRPLLDAIREAKAKGGTAYLDAAAKGIAMLEAGAFANKKRVVVLVTDGVDLNSDLSEEEVIARARAASIPIYTIGIGKPGDMKPVSTVLVLDRSGSMLSPANERDKDTKIKALQDAANRFLNGISAPRRCAILDFGDAPNPPSDFFSQKPRLKEKIDNLQAKGETCLFDAIYDAIATLEADNTEGKRAVVALTDGIDNKSRRRVDEVIQFAQQTKVPLFLLGFGREGELDINVMKQMAEKTGGFFFHADSQDKLIEYFEELSTRIHDDGIDEKALKRLALATGGLYYPAHEVDQLKLKLTEVFTEISTDKKIITRTFESVRPVADGLPRKIKIYLERLKEANIEVKKAIERDVLIHADGRKFQIFESDGKRLVEIDGVSFQVIEQNGIPKLYKLDRAAGPAIQQSQHRGGFVIAQMDHFVYLGLLVALGGLIALPALLRRRPTS